MDRRIWSAVAAVGLIAVPWAGAQSAKKCKAGSKDAACQAAPAATAPAAAPAEAFPFPTEDSRKGANPDGTPSVPPAKPSANGLPEMPTDAVPDPPAESNRPMKLPKDGYSTGGGEPAGSSSSSSSSSADGAGTSSSKSDDDDVAPTVADPNAPVKASKLDDLGAKRNFGAIREKLDATRVADDMKVGKFYLQDGNYQGAYLRYKDAVEHDPDDPEARFYLAEAAARLKKNDEAIAGYQAVLKMDPDGDFDKQAKAGLKKLGAK